MSHRPLCVGIDFGASKVRAVLIEKTSAGARVAAEEARVYPRTDAFVPLPVAEQEAQRGAIRLSEAEHGLGERWIESAVECVSALTASAPGAEWVVGVAAPGLKSDDGRGTCVVRNGPRIPDLLDRLLGALGEKSPTTAPLPRLLGDGECSVWGEVVHVEGRLRDVSVGYYLGAGTGLAEGLWSEGEVRPCEPRAWQLVCEGEGESSFESLLGMDALRAEFGEFPDVLFERGDPRAAAAFAAVARRTGRLLALRATAVTPAPSALVLGQRFGEWFLRDELAALFRAPLLSELEELAGPRVAPSVRGSALRSAPAVGCGWLALQEALAC